MTDLHEKRLLSLFPDQSRKRARIFKNKKVTLIQQTSFSQEKNGESPELFLEPNHLKMEPVNYFHKTLYLRCLTGFLIQSRYQARTVKSHIIHMRIGQTLKHYKYISNLNMLFLDFVESSYILQLYLFLTISTFLRIWKYLTT